MKTTTSNVMLSGAKHLNDQQRMTMRCFTFAQHDSCHSASQPRSALSTLLTSQLLEHLVVERAAPSLEFGDPFLAILHEIRREVIIWMIRGPLHSCLEILDRALEILGQRARKAAAIEDVAIAGL